MNKYNMVRWNFLQCYSLKKIILTAMIVLILDISYLLSKNISTFGDAGVLLLQGYGQGYFSIIDFFFFLIFNGTPLYFASLALDNQGLKTGMHALIRCSSKRKYFQLIQISYFLFLILYFAMHCVVAIVFCTVLGYQFEFGQYSVDLLQLFGIENGALLQLLFNSLLLRLLELLCMQQLIEVIQSKTNKLSIAFIGIICGYFALLVINVSYYPFGISSALRWPMIGNSIIASFGISAVILVLIFLASYLYMYVKGIFELLER